MQKMERGGKSEKEKNMESFIQTASENEVTRREKLSPDAEKLSKFNFPTSNRKKEKKRKIKLN